jgi:transcriptional regulator with GAF, ATPase, and Fis domain
MSATHRTPLWRPTLSGRYLPELKIPERGTSLEGIERELIELALRQTGGNQTRAAQLLDISRDTLRYRIKKFELASEPSRRSRADRDESLESPPEVSVESEH